MSENMDYNDLDAVIDDAEVKDEGTQTEFVVLPKGTYPFSVAKVEFANYQPKPGKTSGITKPCKQIKLGLIVDGGDAGKGWCDENLYFYPSCMFKILALFKSVGLISDGFKGSLPWDQLKGASGTAKFDVESYHSVKFGEERERMEVKSFIKASAPAPEQTAQQSAAQDENWDDIPF